MDQESHDQGRRGERADANTDMHDYLEGRRARESNSGVPGVGFTLLIMAPFAFLIYPLLGLTLWAPFLTAMLLGRQASTLNGAEIGIVVILSVAAFFPAFWLERLVSQFKPYRFLRAVWRLASVFAATVLLRSGHLTDFRDLDLDKALGDYMLQGIVLTILGFFILRRADRLYFPVHAHARLQQEMIAKGIPDQRSSLKRFWYSLFWIIPVVAILNLIIRGFVGGFTDGPQERADFYQQYSLFVYILDFIVWFTLSFTGVLPGTAKVRKYVVGPSVS